MPTRFTAYVNKRLCHAEPPSASDLPVPLDIRMRIEGMSFAWLCSITETA